MLSSSLFSKTFQNLSKNRLFGLFGFMILFFMLFDGIISYVIPLLVVEHGFSKTLLGVILGAGAVSGAFFSFTIYKIFKNPIYRKFFIFMFVSCFVYLFLVWSANSFILFLIAMGIWGFFYDLKNFGTLDFMSRHSKKEQLSSNFGLLQVFQSIGYLLAPLIAGFVIFDIVGWEPFVLALVFISISVIFFAFLLLELRNNKSVVAPKKTSKKNIQNELLLWKKIASLIFPVLLFSLFLNFFDAFFITLGPLVAEHLPLEPFDGFFMVAYLLPPLFVGGLIGSLAKRFGEKNIAVFGLLIGSVILSTFFLFTSPFLIISVVFVSSCFTCIMVPTTQTKYAQCIQQSPKHRKEIQELGDFFGNFGFVIGPIAAGVLADNIGNSLTFSILGILGVLFSILLLFIMPKKINLSKLKK